MIAHPPPQWMRAFHWAGDKHTVIEVRQMQGHPAVLGDPCEQRDAGDLLRVLDRMLLR
jgi:hypothetical protein